MQLSIKVKGDDRLRAALDKLCPRKNPEAIRRAMNASAETLLRRQRSHLEGPRPHRLGRVSGKTWRSIAIDKSALPFSIEVGAPGRLWWLEGYEAGTDVRGHRPFIVPAIDDALPSEIPDHFEREWWGTI